MSRRVRGLLYPAISIALFFVPAAIWTLVSGTINLYQLVWFLHLIFTFSLALLSVALLNVHLPEWLSNYPGLYVLNLVPIAFLGAAGYLLLRRIPKLSPANAAWIALNGAILLMQAVGSLMLYFFGRYSGP